ncbi:MAG: MBOAT family protein [Flavobacteriales bacterium]|nr:MBOAT family protein [Flavobacteriales bacterium]MCX7767974.1 MBOAT family protein [Flavobacteriales bacterium]MDW8409179.1 MBOAT family O-acyltransferase [Flavobacteriales bacterium]
MASILFNYLTAHWIYRSPRPGRVVGIGVILNLTGLIYFKYAGFFSEALARVGFDLPAATTRHLQAVHMPLGISFFTFQNISYLVDVYRREVQPQPNPFHYALYISFFPQLIAGPIIRYRDVAQQLVHRILTAEDFFIGGRRFLTGLAKKVVLADNIGEYVQGALRIPGSELNLYTGWLIPLGYALQLYFDFSGYSDMAIGMGRMFGFRFMENFNFPYIARSFRDYWRRWHISLSTWFRDYLYLPLGGNRRGPLRTYLNLWIVFPLVGLWHGANWNCLVFGILHGSFMVAERMGLERWLERIPRLWGHLYFVMFYLVSLAVFTTDGLDHAYQVLKAMAGLNHNTSPYYAAGLYFSPALGLWLMLALIFSLPVGPWLRRRLENQRAQHSWWILSLARPARLGWYTLLALLSAGEIAGSAYNAFIYYKF